MEAKLPIFLGFVTGQIVNVVTGSLALALGTALLIGIASYAGQQIGKYIHKKTGVFAYLGKQLAKYIIKKTKK